MTVGLRIVPPQNTAVVPGATRAACQGNEWGVAGAPPVMRGAKSGIPHEASAEKKWIELQWDNWHRYNIKCFDRNKKYIVNKIILATYFY